MHVAVRHIDVSRHISHLTSGISTRASHSQGKPGSLRGALSLTSQLLALRAKTGSIRPLRERDQARAHTSSLTGGGAPAARVRSVAIAAAAAWRRPPPIALAEEEEDAVVVIAAAAAAAGAAAASLAVRT